MTGRRSPSDLTRRHALKAGGLGITLAAITAACGDDRTGDDAPGRVGLAPPATDLPDYPVTDTLFLRTASSLEFTTVETYGLAIELGVVDAAIRPTIDRLVEDHQGLGDGFAALTEDAGGDAWTCANPWYVERVLSPILGAIAEWDDPVEASIDLADLAVSWESIVAASHQQFVSQVSERQLRPDFADAASLDARHAAWLAIEMRGAEAYIAPSLTGGDDARSARDGIPQYAITDRLGSLAPIEVVAGPPDANGVRRTFNLVTPAENSYVYDELTCVG
jgi:hypothetical protein